MTQLYKYNIRQIKIKFYARIIFFLGITKNIN